MLLFVFFVGKKTPHPPHAPDLALTDYHLFGPMKKMLGGQKFASDTAVQSVMHKCKNVFLRFFIFS